MAAATGNERRPADTRRCAVTCSWYDVDERRRWRHDIVTFLLLLYYGIMAISIPRGRLQSLLVHKLNYMKQESNKNTNNTN